MPQDLTPGERDTERTKIVQALCMAGSITEAAALLGLSQHALKRRLLLHRVDPSLECAVQRWSFLTASELREPLHFDWRGELSTRHPAPLELTSPASAGCITTRLFIPFPWKETFISPVDVNDVVLDVLRNLTIEETQKDSALDDNGTSEPDEPHLHRILEWLGAIESTSTAARNLLSGITDQASQIGDQIDEHLNSHSARKK